MASIIHSKSNADLTNYHYHQLYVPPGGSETVFGETVTGPIVLDIGISDLNQISSGVLLIGKKRPEKLLGTNSDGTYSIKG